MILQRKLTGTGVVALTAASLFLTGVRIAHAQQPMVLTLEEAIKTGQANSRTMKISDARADAAQAKANEAGTALLPSLKLTVGYQRLSDVPAFAVTLPSYLPPPLGGNSFVLAPTVLNNYSARVTLQQPIFTGFKLESNSRAADYLAQASTFDRNNDRSDLTLNITVAYWTLYQTLETKTFMDENVLRLQNFDTDTKNLLKGGVATRNDVLKIELQLNNAKLTQIDAINDVQLAMMNLNNVIGQPLETQLQLGSKPWPPADPEGKPFREGDAVNNDTTLLAKAFSGRSDIQAVQARVEAAKAGVQAAQGNWFPQLFLTGDYIYARPNQRYQPTLDQFKGTWDVGVQLQFDIWNWGATSDQTEQAKAQLAQTRLSYEQMKDNISLDVKRQALGVRRAKEKVQVAMLAIEQADENQRTTNDKYRQGLATSTDLLDANVALLQAKTNYSAALVENEVAGARLTRATGNTAAENH